MREGGVFLILEWYMWWRDRFSNLGVICWLSSDNLGGSRLGSLSEVNLRSRSNLKKII